MAQMQHLLPVHQLLEQLMQRKTTIVMHHTQILQSPTIMEVQHIRVTTMVTSNKLIIHILSSYRTMPILSSNRIMHILNSNRTIRTLRLLELIKTQTAGGYSSSGHNNQASVWNNGNYANYTSYQYPNYKSDTSSAYASGTAATTYQHPYKQWPDYYSQTEVTCAPGTEHLPVASNSTPRSSVPSTSITSGYATPTNQPQPQPQPPPPPPPQHQPPQHQPQFPPPTSFTPTWRPETKTSELPSIQPGGAASGAHDNYWNQPAPTFQTHLANPVQPQFQNSIDSKTSYENFQEQMTGPQGSNSQYPVAHQVSKSYPSTLQNVSSFDTQRVNNLQIPTNPRIASNAAIGLAKTETGRYATNSAPRPAYVSVPVPKPNDKVSSNSAADPMLKPTMFPKSLCGYVERALGRHKDDDARRAACEAVMKEIITKATADGTLYTKDWDSEPPFTLPDSHFINKENLHYSTPLTTSNYKKSPNRRSKSRWEPLPEEKIPELPVSSSNDTIKYGNWDRKAFSGYSAAKGNSAFNNFKYSASQQKTPGKSAQRPMKRQRVNDTAFSNNEDGSSGSDKEQSLTAYYSGAMALANNPDEKKKRESRCKRFEKGQGHRPDINYFRPKNAAPANVLYSRRASAMMLSKSFDDSVNQAVEDIDWDALTVKGTCQQIEKRFLRLTSAPDPSTVRPEDVLEKALLMVQNSEKNYLFKCDQLKSIRQDLTVQRIRNQLTVKVYETHGRLAMEVGDLAEYNQCQSQLQILYSEGIEGCIMEFAAYNLLCVILHSNNKRDLLSSMSRLTQEAKEDEAVKHALAVIAAVTSGNYVTFFKLYKTAPNLNTCLMDLYVEKMRYKAVVCMSRSYRKTIPILYIAHILRFGNGERDSSGFEECVEWLKAHGASLTADNNEVDAKASSSTLFMPEPEDAVAHGDSSLAVNDFLARTS
ncbi:SAC3 family protein A [Linum grandiflorum]